MFSLSTHRLLYDSGRHVNSAFMLPMDRVLAHLDEQRRTLASFAIAIGVNGQVVNNWKKRGIPRDKLLAVARELGWSLDYLMTGRDGKCTAREAGLPYQAATGQASTIKAWEAPEDLPPDKYALIPRRTVNVSAGNGSLVFEEDEAPPLSFSTAWIKRKRIKPENAVVVRVSGDSMAPGIQDGDVLLVDLARVEVMDGEVYVLRYGHELRVKRLRTRWDGTIVLQSDNPDKTRHPDEAIPLEAEDHIRIIGQAIWRGGDI